MGIYRFDHEPERMDFLNIIEDEARNLHKVKLLSSGARKGKLSSATENRKS
jgi:hypothetical protein